MTIKIIENIEELSDELCSKISKAKIEESYFHHYAIQDDKETLWLKIPVHTITDKYGNILDSDEFRKSTDSYRLQNTPFTYYWKRIKAPFDCKVYHKAYNKEDNTYNVIFEKIEHKLNNNDH